MKKISVLIPCYNEVENAGPISKAVTDILEKELLSMIMNLYLLIMTPQTEHGM